MADRPPDEVFAQQLLKVGLATDNHVKEALREQTERALKGVSVPLAQILVERGVIAAFQRQNIEKKLESQREEAKRLGPYRVLRKLGEAGVRCSPFLGPVDVSVFRPGQRIPAPL